METTPTTSTAQPLTIKSLFGRDDVRKKFQELLGKRATSFITSVLQIVASNDLLAKADPATIYHAAAVAATLDLPLNNALGFAYIVPYNQKQKDGSYKQVAQFQMGYKGYIQLAQRSGQVKTIAVTPVYEGQLVEENPLTGHTFDWKNKKSNVVIGYASYFQLLNGFDKLWYWTVDEVKEHGLKYSQTFKKGYGLWKDDFDAMAKKTVLKALLSLYAPLSVEMQRAVVVDQSVINDSDTMDISYPDNEPVILSITDKSNERIALMIQDATTKEELNEVVKQLSDDEFKQFADIITVRTDELVKKSKSK